MGNRAGSPCKGEVIEEQDDGYAVRIKSGPPHMRGCIVTVLSKECADVEFQGKRGRQISWGEQGTGKPESSVGDDITCLIAVHGGQPVVTRWFNASTHSRGRRTQGVSRHYSTSGTHLGSSLARW